MALLLRALWIVGQEEFWKYNFTVAKSITISHKERCGLVEGRIFFLFSFMKKLFTMKLST